MVATSTTMITRYEALMACEAKANELNKGRGGAAQMARDLDLTTTAIGKMLHSAKQMSVGYVLLAERLYGVSRHDLRPDIYPRNYPPAPEADDRFLGVDQAAGQDTPANRGHYFSRRVRPLANGKAA